MGRPMNIAVILTVRSTSSRLPDKVMSVIEGKPLLLWLVERFSTVADVIIATPVGDKLIDWATAHGVKCYAGSENDVTDRIWQATQEFAPHSPFVMRGLGDCPLVSTDFVKRSVDVMKQYSAEAFSWVSPPFKYTVYGASEFPRARSVWNTIQKEGIKDEREHPDLFYHRNRDRFSIVYHEPPPAKFFSNFRLEVDWPEDIELIRIMSKHFGRLPTLDEALDHLQKSKEWRINKNRVERTGLSVSYRQSERQKWWELMAGKKVVLWNDKVLDSKPNKQLIFCKGGTCLIGCTDGTYLYDKDGVIVPDNTAVACACGTGRTWFKSK